MGKDLKTMEWFFFSAYCDIMMEATYRKLLVYLLLKPPITVDETTKIWSKQFLKANNTGDRLCCRGTNYFVTVVMFMNHLQEIGIDLQTK